MLKAIWPSLVRLPNHLPANANITTAGEGRYNRRPTHSHVCYSHHVLLLVLVDTIPLHAGVTAENSLALLGQSYHRPTCVDSHAYLGLCQNAI